MEDEAKDKKPAEDFKKLIQTYQELVATNSPSAPTTPRISIDDEIARAEKLKNDDAEQDITLKKKTLNRLFLFLGAETALIFFFTFLQATSYFGFYLEEWSFKLVVTATLAQITAMLYVAVNYLFPKNKNK